MLHVLSNNGVKNMSSNLGAQYSNDIKALNYLNWEHC